MGHDIMTTKRFAWEVWSVWGSTTPIDPGEYFVEAFADKGQARHRVRLLLRGCPWRKPIDYQLRRRRQDRSKLFEFRKV